MGRPRLITIPLSHYCEKARWALDRAGVEYTEERHVQGVSVFCARRAGGGLTTPVLVADDEVLGESEDIVRWADRHLPPERRLVPEDPAAREDALGLARCFDDGLGQAGRRLIYALMLPYTEELLAINNQGLPAWEERLARAAWPAITLAVRIRLRMPRGPYPEDERIARAAFDRVEERLADGRPYLCGERFSIADLTFAALAAPVIGSPRYGIRLPGPDELPPEVASLVHRFREHPAGRFALRVIETERPLPPAGPGARAGTTSTAGSRSPGRSRHRSGPTASR
jgi:glutathione S-transferase